MFKSEEWCWATGEETSPACWLCVLSGKGCSQRMLSPLLVPPCTPARQLDMEQGLSPSDLRFALGFWEFIFVGRFLFFCKASTGAVGWELQKRLVSCSFSTDNKTSTSIWAKEARALLVSQLWEVTAELGASSFRHLMADPSQMSLQDLGKSGWKGVTRA